MDIRRYIILIHCPDQKGIIAGVTDFIHKSKGNIEYIDQYVDRTHNHFFMRIEVAFDHKQFFWSGFQEEMNSQLGRPYNMQLEFYDQAQTPKMAVFISKYDHCLYDLLALQQSGKLNCEIPFVLSNHTDLKFIADQFNIPFIHVPVDPADKQKAAQKQLELLAEHQVDFVVLARYMQIIHPEVIEAYPSKIINIHHSFLPAFPGAKPYHTAYDRGVKIIGATSHYVTEELDAGPIIEQDVVRVSHAHEVQDFIRLGRDLERLVLMRAVELHTKRKVLVMNNKTVVFT